MDFNQLHLSHPMWLWSGIAIPLVWILFLLFYQGYQPLHQLEKYIDKHLLPYLLVNKSDKKDAIWKALLLWTLVWSCLTVALAGPRWSFREMETFSQDQSLVILLDLSESMNATDIKPSRLGRAKQKIEDLLNLSKGVKIGLVAFAADPHMIAPLTEDKETIRHLLSSLETDLIYVQGSRLSSALEMASTMLDAEPGNNKALLVISDGGFEDATAIMTAKKLAEKEIVIHVMGMGTLEGAPLHDKKNKAPVLTKLEKERLREISTVGNGRYIEPHYSDYEEMVILQELGKRAEAQLNIGKKNQFWDERFYLFILPMLPIFLWWFRRGSLFASILILFAPFEVEALSFKNSEELGKQAFEAEDYETAGNAFQDPYRKGVAHYRANNFAEAEKMFRQSSREDVACSAAYNLGNALVQQQKLKEAISVYEDLLKRWPGHTKAKENLELIKKMQEEQKQNPPQSQDSDQQQDQNENKSENNSDDQKQSQENQQQKEQESDQQKQNDPEAGQQQEDLQKNAEQNESKEQPQEDPQQSQEQQPQGAEEKESNQKEDREVKAAKSQEDHDADLWLNQIENDPKQFLKNKCYIESKRNGTKEGIDPW